MNDMLGAYITSIADASSLTTSFPGSLILPPHRTSEERPWSRATLTIENTREESSVIRQLVALGFVEFKVSYCVATDIARDG